MAQVIHPTQASYQGPWLLDKAALAALDKVIEEQWKQLEVHKKSAIESAKRRLLYNLRNSDYYKNLTDPKKEEEEDNARKQAENDPAYSEDAVSVTLTLAPGTKVRESSFARAMAAPECDNAWVTKAEVKLICGGIKAELTVPTQENTKPLSIVSLPEGSDPAREVFVKLRMWAEEYRPDWLRVVNGAPPVAFLALACLFGLLIFVAAAVTGSVTTESPWGDEASELIKKGVGPEDQGRALRLILQKEIKPFGSDDKLEMTGWPPFTILTICVILLPLCVQATTAFEIGKGKMSVKWQKLYGKFLRIVLPTFLFMGVLASFLGSWILELVKHR